METIFNPLLPSNLIEFYQTLLSVSGVLFGLAFAAMLFILQSGFSSFKYSRRMFLDVYMHLGRQLLYSLAYITITPFMALFFKDYPTAITIIYIVYVINFSHATLDYAKEDGYIKTLTSSKFIPRHYGRVRGYFRSIKNRGALKNIFHFTPIFLLWSYPFIISIVQAGTIILTKTAVFYSCVIPLFYSIYKITKFIPEFFIYTNMELSSEKELSSDAQTEDEKTQNICEKNVLKEHLISSGYYELDEATPREFMDGTIELRLLVDGKNEAWFNSFIHINNSTPQEIKNNVLIYANSLARMLSNSKASISKFVLSFHIYINNDTHRNMFFRASRSELTRVLSDNPNNYSDIEKLENKLFDELFR